MRIWFETSSLVALVLILSPCHAVHAQDGPRKGSPFEALRWVENQPEVQIDDTWYRPLAIDGVSVPDILDFCERRWPRQVKKRFGEDLVEAMQRMGHTVPRHVTLQLKHLDDGPIVELPDIEVTFENRESIRRTNVQAEDELAFQMPDPPAHLSRDQALADIEAFKRGLDSQFAYRHWRGVDLEAHLQPLRASLGETVATADLAAKLNRVLNLFGDGHARIRSAHARRSRLHTPFLLAPAQGGIVALKPDRSGFLDDQRPYIVSIDNHSMDQWLEAAAPDVTAGSEQLVRRRGLGNLRGLELIRPRLGVPERDFVQCRLSGPAGQPVDSSLPMTAQKPIYGTWPRHETALIDHNLGYLRLEKMDRELVPHLRSAMDSFRNTDGLIVDVRGNSGGGRELLIALAGYLLGPEESPWVANVAKYRLCDRFDEDHLDKRFMYRANDARWTDAQRAAIRSFMDDGFEPEWTAGEGFSVWHFLVLDRTGHASEYFYDKPVVVLSDASCFSATDIFLAALKGRPRITLMGTASGGGSARSQRFTLPNSLMDVRCASMASFRPDGRLYDGRGVEVDIELLPDPHDFLVGGTDTVLEAAIKRLRK